MTDYAQAVEQHGSIRAAAAALGIAESTFRDRLNGRTAAPRRDRPALAAPTLQGTPVVRSVADLRRQYDAAVVIPAKIDAALKQLGSTGAAYETDFARLAGMSLADLTRYRDAYAAHVAELRDRRGTRRVWFGSTAAADEARGWST